MRINNTSQNFYGYKNIIANTIEDEVGRTYSLSVQLNNTGERDLDRFISMKSNIQHLAEDLKSDVINLTLVEKFNGEKDLLLEDNPLLSGEELCILADELPKDIYKKIENNAIKGYDFLSSLLKRISHDFNIQEDDSMEKTKDSYKQNVYKLSESPQVASEVVDLAFTDVEVPQPVAKRLNSYISDTMEYFFS